MTIADMVYDFKKKLGKVDSQQHRNLLIPEIDWALNEAQEIFIKLVAQPRVAPHLGFEKTQRSIDDIRTLVVRTSIPVVDNMVALPIDYLFYISGHIEMRKDPCGIEVGRLIIVEHDDKVEESPFDKSSFEWRVVNGLFTHGGIQLHTDGTFVNQSCTLSYIKQPSYMHNAKDFGLGSYKLPSGKVLSGAVDCELPPHTHREIVDIAVAMVSGELLSPDYQIKLNKLNINELK